MYFYPTIIVDNFFKDPLKVREYALTLDYGKGTNFSGTRTKDIFNFNPFFADSVCKKTLMSSGLIFNNYAAQVHFHLTGEEFGDSGWPHVDFSVFSDTKFASVTYLNVSPKGLNSGTSVYRLSGFEDVRKSVSIMQTTFKTGEDNVEEKNKTINNYEETIRVGGIFNRMVAYDSRRPHCGNSYFGNTKDEQRLTLLIFFKEINLATPYGHSPIVCADILNDL